MLGASKRKGALEPSFIKLPNTAWGQGEKPPQRKWQTQMNWLQGSLLIQKPAYL